MGQLKRLVLYIPDDLDDRLERIRKAGRWSRSEVGKLLIEAALREVDGVIPDGFIEGLLRASTTEGRDK